MRSTVDPTQEILGELLATSPGSSRRLRGRPLTAGEWDNLRLFFGNALTLSKVRVHSHPFSKDGAFCIDNHVFFPRAFYRPDFSITQPGDPASSSNDDKRDLAWLVHECCHVWQFQRKVRRYRWYKALLEHIQYGDTVYLYDIDERDCLAAFRFEQQGQIIQDYAWWYLSAGGHPGGSLMDRYRTVLGCSIPTPDVISTRPSRRKGLRAWSRILCRY